MNRFTVYSYLIRYTNGNTKYGKLFLEPVAGYHPGIGSVNKPGQLDNSARQVTTTTFPGSDVGL